MHGPELEYIKDANEKNWMSTVGENINEVERLACETVGCKYAVALATGVGGVLVNLFWSVIYRRSAKPTKT